MTQATARRPQDRRRWLRGAACLAALLPSLVWANWTKVGESEGVTLYMDRSSIQRGEYTFRVWEIQELKAPDPDGVLSRRYMSEYDCKHQMHRIGNMVSYSGSMLTGRKVFEMEEMSYWRKVSGRSLFTLSYVIHCGR
jgi:hypothetical protein